ncbi:thioredoxin family protein [Paenibacillus oleatilyticus]|uniref:thioredoxin family protein n=1 Tax=Paenibacillus oleatilyticus TaxID=2594886 RepID=UPI001C1F3C51|nr:thioredoxin family protein [Paenibacillus oleatilyticus]MBU7318738.1 thioredoxin family protein [Paenibacillus oleatilyticus]
MTLEEWSEKDLLAWTLALTEAVEPEFPENAAGGHLAHAEPRYVFFYTPLCGTCKVGERMLEVVTALNPRTPMGRCNINFSPVLARSWQIESVPCLVRWHRGTVADKKYRFDDVQELHRWINVPVNG